MPTKTQQAQPRIAPRHVQIPPVGLEGLLRLPDDCSGLVVFAHGSGSGRLSPRNNYVADALGRDGLGTLLFDLLTEAEARDRANVFDIELLAERLLQAVAWAAANERTRQLRVGLFGASTGAAAALVAASRAPDVGAVVSRGGRADLAGVALRSVRAPTLLIVGSLDREVLALNRAALAQLSCEKDLRVVPGATHLFEEPGTLDVVETCSKRWFLDHLGRKEPP
jgi:putative phosphoribosyl transferase